MEANISKKIELVANLAIILVACLFVIAFTRVYLFRQGVQPTNTENQKELATKPTVSSLDIDWKLNRQTLVLAISTTCHFCTESAPFYKKIAKARCDTHFVALFPQSSEEGRKYLDDLGIAVDEVRGLTFDKIGVRGTPTLLLIDSAGIVKDYWLGRLAPQDESKVLAKLCQGGV